MKGDMLPTKLPVTIGQRARELARIKAQLRASLKRIEAENARLQKFAERLEKL